MDGCFVWVLGHDRDAAGLRRKKGMDFRNFREGSRASNLSIAVLLLTGLAAIPSVSPAQSSAPVLTGVPAPTVLVDHLYAFSPTVSNPGFSALTYLAVNKPQWLELETYQGIPYLYGNPGASDVGQYDDISLVGYNDNGSAAVGPFSIEVVPADRPWARLTWEPPRLNTDGSALTDLAGYRIYHFLPDSFSFAVTELMDPDATEYLVGNLASGTNYFCMTAIDSAGQESTYSAIVSTTVSN
jgi:hypothetical protein